MAMYDVGNFKSGDTDFADTFQLFTQLIPIDFSSCVSENAIPFTFAYIKCLAITWIDQAVDISFEL